MPFNSIGTNAKASLIANQAQIAMGGEDLSDAGLDIHGFTGLD